LLFFLAYVDKKLYLCRPLWNYALQHIE
jgi:hypothetical protein